MSKRTIAIYGGSFNPPHAAHQLVALYVLETQPVDALWFVPTFAHPFGKALAPYDDRVAMCKLAAEPLGARVAVSRAEQELAARPEFVASRTLNLIEFLAAREPDAAFRLVIGADILHETASWHRWDELMRRAPAIVVGRAGIAVPEGATVTGVEMPAISGTEIRRLLAADETDSALRGLVPTSVMRYIRSRKLYP